MTQKKSSFDLFDYLLACMVVASLLAGVLVLLSSPAWWGYCIAMLDMRFWTRWTWTCIGTSLLLLLLMVRLWPERKC